MATTAYRADRGQGRILMACLLIVLCGTGGILALLTLLWDPKETSAWNIAWLALPAGVMIATAVIGGGRQRRKRLAGIAEKLTRLGLRPVMEPDEGQRQSLWGRIGHLAGSLDVGSGAEKVQWLATMNSGEREGEVWVFETKHTTGGGRTLEYHERTVAAWPADHPGLPGARLGNLPGFLMSRIGKGQRRMRKHEELKDPAFEPLAKHWCILGNADAGKRFLTPEMRAELERSPKGESWSLGGGWACCIFRNSLQAGDLGIFLERAQRLLKAPRLEKEVGQGL